MKDVTGITMDVSSKVVVWVEYLKKLCFGVVTDINYNNTGCLLVKLIGEGETEIIVTDEKRIFDVTW